MSEKTKPKIKRVLFYTTIPRLFRSTLIGNLYEIAQVYPVVLLSEKLDSQTEKALKDKTLFPKLEKIVPVHQYTGRKMSLWTRHRYFAKLAKSIIQHYKPDIVVVNGGDFFESYLRRFAREINALNIFFVRILLEQTKSEITEYILRIGYLKAPKFLPRCGKILFSKFRMFLGQFLCFWILPLLAGHKPFIKEPSRILITDRSRFSGVDYFIVFSKKYYDILLKGGLPAEKLCILTHPLAKKGKTRNFFKKIYFSNISNKKNITKRILTVMWAPEPIGFKRENFVLISKEELWKSRIEIITLITEKLKGWKIYIKPHPVTEDIPKLVQIFKLISNQIEVTKPTEPADKYIEMSDVIVGISPASTSLSDAFLQCPEKPILSIDLQSAFAGDVYKHSEGIEYIDNEKDLINLLKLIKDNKYEKPKIKIESEGFSSFVDLLNYLILKHEK